MYVARRPKQELGSRSSSYFVISSFRPCTAMFNYSCENSSAVLRFSSRNMGRRKTSAKIRDSGFDDKLETQRADLHNVAHAYLRLSLIRSAVFDTNCYLSSTFDYCKYSYSSTLSTDMNHNYKLPPKPITIKPI